MKAQGQKSGNEDRSEWIVAIHVVLGFTLFSYGLVSVIGLNRPTSYCLIYIAAVLPLFPFAGRGKINRWSKNKNHWTFRTWTANVLISSIFVYFITALAYALGE